MLPNVLMSLLLICVLIFTTYRTFLSGFELWNKEVNNPKANFYNRVNNYGATGSDNEYVEDEADVLSLSTITDADLRLRMNQVKLNTSISTIFESSAKKTNKDYKWYPLDRILDSETQYIQWDKLKYIIVTLSVMILSTVLLGNKDVKSLLGISQCSTFYWMLYLWYLIYLGFMISI